MNLNRLFLTAALVAVVFSSTIGEAHAGDEIYVAPAESAYIVFVKAGKGAKKAAFTFYDSDLTCLSVMEDGSTAEIIPVKPGTHTMYTAAMNSHRMEFDVEAGRTYFVRVSIPRYGYATVKIVPAKRDTETFGQVNEWIASAKPSNPNSDPCRGLTIEKDKKGRNRAEKMRDAADAKWKESAEYRERLTLKKKDGLTAAEVGKL